MVKSSKSRGVCHSPIVLKTDFNYFELYRGGRIASEVLVLGREEDKEGPSFFCFLFSIFFPE